MQKTTQVQSFRDIHVEGAGNTLVINQVAQISADEIERRPFIKYSPYLGLNRFEEQDNDVFFGRDQLVADLLKLMSQRNLVVVSGASGSGKSSLVRAGLLPQLNARLPRGRFHAIKMTPKADPFDSLRMALWAVCQDKKVQSGRLAELDANTADALVHTIAQLRPAKDHWVLLIDQFEQIFTHCGHIGRRTAFVDGLARLAERTNSEVKIILTMRSEFFGGLSSHPEFSKLVSQGLCLMRVMQDTELRAAIEQPAARNGVVFEPGLVNRIIADVRGQPGALPLLQYTLDRLWDEEDKEKDRTLKEATYHQLGGVEAALRGRADMLYALMSAREGEPRSVAQKERIRLLFLGLVDLARTGPEAFAVSKRARLSEFTREEDRELIAEFTEAKLLVTNTLIGREEERPGEVTVELAHEALLLAWPRLRRWIEEGREVLYVRNRLAADALCWEETKHKQPGREREEGELWRGSKLEQALRLAESGDFERVLGGLSERERAFLAASKQVVEENAAEKKVLLDQIEVNRRSAEEQRRLAVQHELDGYVERGRQLLLVDDKPLEAVLWLEEAMHRGSTHRGLPLLLREALRFVDMQRLTLLEQGASEEIVKYSHDGRYILTGGHEFTIRIWSAEKGTLIATTGSSGDRITGTAFSPDDTRLAVASADGVVREWAVDTNSLISELRGHEQAVNSVDYSADGTRILTAGADGTVREWAAGTGQLVRIFRVKDPERKEVSADSEFLDVEVNGACYNPQCSRILAWSSDHTVREWDASTGHCLADFGGDDSLIERAVYRPDGSLILTTGWNKTAMEWQSGTGRLQAKLVGHEERITSASYSPDGRRVVTSSEDGSVREWESESGNLLVTIDGQGEGVQSAVYRPDGLRILTTGPNGTVQVWQSGIENLDSVYVGHGQYVSSAVYSPDGRRILTASQAEDAVREWNAEEARICRFVMHGPKSSIKAAAYSPDGSHILSAHADRVARQWQAGSGRASTVFVGHTDVVTAAVYDANFRRVVTASTDETARQWNAETGELINVLRGHRAAILGVSYSPDGRRVLTRSWRTVWEWDAETGEMLFVLRDLGDLIAHAEYSPDGRRFLTVSHDHYVREWEAGTGRPVMTFFHRHPILLRASYSPDGTRLLTVSVDNSAVEWEAVTGRRLAMLTGHEASLPSARYSPDGLRIVTSSEDTTAREWESGTGQLLAILEGHGAEVQAVDYSPDGLRIVTAAKDGELREWESETGRLLATRNGPEGDVVSVRYSRDGRRILSLHAMSTMIEWESVDRPRDLTGVRELLRCRLPICLRGSLIVKNEPIPEPYTEHFPPLEPPPLRWADRDLPYFAAVHAWRAGRLRLARARVAEYQLAAERFGDPLLSYQAGLLRWLTQERDSEGFAAESVLASMEPLRHSYLPAESSAERRRNILIDVWSMAQQILWRYDTALAAAEALLSSGYDEPGIRTQRAASLLCLRRYDDARAASSDLLAGSSELPLGSRVFAVLLAWTAARLGDHGELAASLGRELLAAYAGFSAEQFLGPDFDDIRNSLLQGQPGATGDLSVRELWALFTRPKSDTIVQRIRHIVQQ